MPFALLILSGDTTGPLWVGQAAAALAFLLVGAGLHTTQTVGLALATDLAPAHARPKVVALLCAMLLAGMMGSAVLFGLALANFSAIRLIQVIQGAALVTIVLNGIALWKQEPRSPDRTTRPAARPSFARSWQDYAGEGSARRRLAAIALGTAGFSMQDILLEPYGGQILGLSVGQTTALTAMLAAGGGLGLIAAARWLNRGGDPYRVAAVGSVIGIMAFSAVVFAAPLASARLFAAGVTLIGVGGGLFAHGTLTASMAKAGPEDTGLALGAWGAAQASAAGMAIAASGILRDAGAALAQSGALGEGMNEPAIGYLIVYHVEIALLFASLVALGPLVRADASRPGRPDEGRSGSFDPLVNRPT